MIRSILKVLLLAIVTAGLLSAAAGTLTGFYYYFRLTRDMPRIEKLNDYMPRAVSGIYAQDGTLMAEVFDELRYPVRLDEVPIRIRNAFLAAEDANFYSHPGVDFTSILRAVWVNLHAHASRQGASTITQQVVKSLLLSREKTMERKAKEAILAYRLEKYLTKDEIFSIYLNEIFLGAHAYGIKAAAKAHFHKEMKDLTIAEAAFLAGLPQKPSELINPKNREEASRRQRYVLDQMLKNNMLSAREHQEALREKLTIYPPDLNTIYRAPYYASFAMQVADDALKQIDRKLSLKSPGGFKIITEADLKANETGVSVLQQGLREVDKRRGWRGPLKQPAAKLQEEARRGETAGGLLPKTVYLAHVVKVAKTGVADVRVGDFEGAVNLAAPNWAKRFLTPEDEVVGGDPAKTVLAGDTIEVSLDLEKEPEPVTDITKKVSFVLDQSPQLEGAFLVSNVLTGAVKVVVGGYDYRRSVFNRATQGMLQPGSSFKPFIYVASLDHLHYTPATMVPDSPISLVAGNGQIWSPGNFDNKFLGPITLRTALEKSRNVVSVFLLNRLGVQRGIDSARNLGITTPIGRDLSIALGTPEVKLIEMVHAYGAFAAGGWLADTVVVTKIYDRDGNLIYEKRPKQKKVLSEETAFVMANMMKGVVERGTATTVKALGKPVAGKTGTTNDHMDAWFIGYTPEWVGGVWVGFDVKKTIGKTETGGKAAAPVFLRFMQQFLKDEPPIDFDIPDGVVPVAIDRASGRPVNPDAPGAFIEYFKSGTEPAGADEGGAGGGGQPTEGRDYLSSDEF